jgi:multidrug resistance efflux pump
MALLHLRARNAIAKGLGLFVIVSMCGAADAPSSADIGGTGHIEPRNGVISLSSVGGVTIKSIKVHPGQTVKRGDVLMEFDDTQARMDEKVAETAYNAAKTAEEQTIASEAIAVKLAANHYRAAKGLADGYRSLGPDATSLTQRQTYDGAAADALGALNLERRKQAQILASGTADLVAAKSRFVSAQNMLAKFQLTAPNDGVILMVNQHEGEIAGGGPIVAMGDISQMYVTCQVFQGDLLKVREGMKATITSNAMNKTLTGTVVSISRLITTATQTGDVRIKLNDTDLASRLVGMEVEVKILL